MTDALAGRGISEPFDGTVGGSEGEEERVEKAWSNAADSRSNRKNGTSAEYKRIGQLKNAAGNCTATLVGRRLILTAAHCVLDGNGNFLWSNFTAHSDASDIPYGTQTATGAWYGNYAGCQDWATCVPEDWAVLILNDTFQNGHPGWAGYGYSLYESHYTSLWTNKRQHGYPICAPAHAPSPCVFGDPYGQTFNCSIGDFRYPFLGGYNAAFTFGCDTSPGHSGGSIYDVNTGWVLGISTNEMCTTGPGFQTCANEPNAAVKANPNLAKRLDAWIVNLINNARVWYF